MPLAVTSFDSGPYLHLLFKTRATCELSELMEDGKIAEGAAKFYVACVASGLAELHAKRGAQRVSLDALTVDERGHAVLMDFCFAENMNTVARLTDYGLPYYLSPEQVSGQGDKSCDCGSGILLMEMMTGTPPWTTATRRGLGGEHFRADHVVRASASSCPRFRRHRQFIDNLLEPNPTKRMGARGAGWVRSRCSRGSPASTGRARHRLAPLAVEPVCARRRRRRRRRRARRSPRRPGDASWYEGWSPGIAK